VDLRKYTQKRVNTKNVLKYEYTYCSSTQVHNERHNLVITVDKNLGTAFSPGYELLMILDGSGKISEIMRLSVMHNAGSLVKKFPETIEQKAEMILKEIVISTTEGELSNLSVLADIQKRIK
jgi:hypothetical protein